MHAMAQVNIINEMSNFGTGLKPRNVLLIIELIQ